MIMGRLRAFVLLLSFLGMASSLLGGVATVVRAHPWLVRGLAHESLAGVKFNNGLGGALNGIKFTFRLENCTKEDLSDFRLWIQPNNDYAFYEPTAVRLDDGIMSKTVSGEASATTFTVEFTNASWMSITGNRSKGWLYTITGKGDYLWLTARISPAISRKAKIYVDVSSETLQLASNVYTIENGIAKVPHRIYPYRYRVSAYLVYGRLGSGDVFSDAPKERISNLTELIHISCQPIYNATEDCFKIGWSDAQEAALERLKVLRAAYHPWDEETGLGARLRVSLVKGGNLTLASNGGAEFTATALGHASGSKYCEGFAEAIVTFLEEKGLNGLDIDWEYPNTLATGAVVSNGEYEKYGALGRELAERFFERGYELSFCTNQSGWQIPGGNTLATADMINSMAYGPWPTFLGNSVMTQGIEVCTSRNVPKRRIIVGQSIYSNAKYQYGWDEMVARIKAKTSDPIERWDTDTVWEAWTHNGKSGDYANFTGPTTYRAKVNRARLEGYAGVMSWGYYTDTPPWFGAERMSLAMHQAQTMWPQDAMFPTPPQNEAGAYELDSEEDWFWFQEEAKRNPAVNIVLTGDITFAHDPLPIESFTGVLEGDGHRLILPKDVWICTFDRAGLFETFNGCAQNLTIDLYGRVVSRADRKHDVKETIVNKSSSYDTSTQSSDCALFATQVGGGARIKQVTLNIHEGAEIQGVQRTAGLAANVWCSATDTITIEEVQINVNGALRIRADSSAETRFDIEHGCLGALLGWTSGPTGASINVKNCSVKLGPSACINAETGTLTSVAAGIGGLNNLTPSVSALSIDWHDDAIVTGAYQPDPEEKATPMPAIASYTYGMSTTAPNISGQIKAKRRTFPWEEWLFDDAFRFIVPGYGLRLR